MVEEQALSLGFVQHHHTRRAVKPCPLVEVSRRLSCVICQLRDSGVAIWKLLLRFDKIIPVTLQIYSRIGNSAIWTEVSALTGQLFSHESVHS